MTEWFIQAKRFHLLLNPDTNPSLGWRIVYEIATLFKILYITLTQCTQKRLFCIPSNFSRFKHRFKIISCYRTSLTV